MLFARWNKNGSKVMCEQSQVAEMEKNGFDLKECPETEVEVVEEVKPEPEKAPAKKTTRRTAQKKKEETDIVLD